MSNRKLFSLSILCTMLGVLGYLYVERQIDLRHQPTLTRLRSRVFLTSQLVPEHLPFLKRLGIRTLVDMRPDGEAADQPSSDAMKQAATARGIDFHYIPVPHESLPDDAVSALRSVLEDDRAWATVLYCRTGRRAVRLYALASASQFDGPDADEIQRLVQEAGFTADDLKDNIAQRIALRGRPPSSGAK